MSQVPQTGEVHELFARALAEPVERRAAFLDRVCSGRPDLRGRIEHLLRLTEDEDGFLDRAAINSDSTNAASENVYAAGRTIGAYRLLRPLGRGGMAEVWLAERREGGFQQQAALKLIPNARGSIGQRFVGEREILAGLAHPGIARLYDGGIETDGAAYMVMEYVEGEHLIAYANAHRLPLTERLILFLQICDAVAYAQTHLVVHRDLKPSNILVTADGQAKLLDFGIAKLLDAEPAEDTTRTLYLSPKYAAPEQLTSGTIGTATDVYALGVILFELLTDRLPWSDDAAPMAAAVKRLLDTPLPPPSKLATERSPVPARALRGDLDAIAGKALRRETDERYPDARALADDVRRHLDHRPVQARAGARVYVARRFMRRNWLPLSTAAVLFVAMAAATVAVAWQASKARAQAQRAEAVQSFMVDLFKTNSSQQKNPVKARQTTARELLDIGAKRIENSLEDAPEAKLELLRVMRDLYVDFSLKDEAFALAQEVVSLSRRIDGPESYELVADLMKVSTSSIGSKWMKLAGPALGEAKSILDKIGDFDSNTRANVLYKMAQYYQYSDVLKSYSYSSEAVGILAKLPESGDLCSALFFNGLAAGTIRRLSEAVSLLRRSIDMSGRVNGNDDGSLAIGYYELARAESKNMQHEAALSSARKSLSLSILAEGEGGIRVVRGQLMVAQVLSAAEQAKEALDIAGYAKDKMLGMDDSIGVNSKAFAFESYGRAMLAAGSYDAALAACESAVDVINRGNLPENARISPSRCVISALLELGRFDLADDLIEKLLPINGVASGGMSIQSHDSRARIALDSGRIDAARSILSQSSSEYQDPIPASVWGLRRDLMAAEIELRAEKFGPASKNAADVGNRARASEIAPYVRSVISDSELIEGLARLRSGDPATARPILEHALATRVDLYLPKSPKIAEVQLALAECEMAQGKRGEAAKLVEQAAAIETQYSSLSPRYVEPLKRLRRELVAKR
ncbi:serine/threonine-protein kinase [Dokdonella sp.]|uniref:serine/threonine-protein kinase n=1 Tax=Dokdonella sp. TaxID=2291710 RepID=UPI001B192EA2|nr:serine/threonine-protein kinase [Dokdonella sp.]MBO9662571.1 serine/threonine protein kinase [Dokdonella sp.]